MQNKVPTLSLGKASISPHQQPAFVIDLEEIPPHFHILNVLARVDYGESGAWRGIDNPIPRIQAYYLPDLCRRNLKALQSIRREKRQLACLSEHPVGLGQKSES